ncbi:MAG: ATP-binding protein [Candidatus Methanofastidiosa archaeon]|nr:ATP-binding protein [Candidatus Methanofastidiosa archaeon]
MLETNIRIVRPGMNLYVWVRQAQISGSALSPDLIEKSCGVIRNRFHLAATPHPEKQNTLLVASYQPISSLHLDGEDWELDVIDAEQPAQKLTLSNKMGEKLIPVLVERAFIAKIASATKLWTVDSPRIWYEADPVYVENEIAAYGKAKTVISESNNKIVSLTQDREILAALKQKGASLLVANQEFNRLSAKRQEALRSELVKKGNENLADLIQHEVTTIDAEIKVLQQAVINQTKVLEPLNKKIKLNKALEGLTKELSDLQQILLKINELTKKSELATVQKTTAISGLVEAYRDFDTQQHTIFGTVQFDNEFSFLKIETVTFYNTGDLKLFIERNINTRDSDARLKQNSDIGVLFGDAPIQPIAETIEKMIVGLVDGRIKTKVDADDLDQVISQLLKNRYEIDYLNSVKTRDENTHFKDMTGGQKAIALLELVFRFDDEKYPILIDQPEDDLDVVGVATDLVNFIKSEKNERQIIIVSHNASLVICADTEEVLVSSGHKNTQGKYNFSYLTGSIENMQIRDEIIKVLEGGREALKQRARKLNFRHEI